MQWIRLKTLFQLTKGVKMNKLYPVFEAAIMLHISESTLYRWIHQKKIEYIKIGSRVLFSEDVLKKYIEQNTIIPA